MKRFGIWLVTIKHPKYVTERHQVEADSAEDAIKRFRGRYKNETYAARFLRGPKPVLKCQVCKKADSRVKFQKDSYESDLKNKTVMGNFHDKCNDEKARDL